MAGFMGFAAEASDLLPESAYHARAAREARDGDYAFTARAFPWLYDQEAARAQQVQIDKLTPLELNDHTAASAEGGLESGDSSSIASSSARPSVGLELTLHESHAGHLIGSVVWDGGKALAWLLENMHSRVRELDKNGRGFMDVIAPPPTNAPRSIFSAFESASSFTSAFTPAAMQEYLAARADGCCFDIPREFLVGARVLELGAGTGITGLACVKLGAREVCITDILELMPLIKENVRRNCPGTLREEWVDSTPAVTDTSADATNAAAGAASPTLDPANTAAPSAPALGDSAAADATSPANTATVDFDEMPPLTDPYVSCTNCDDLCERALACSICDASLCEVCDEAFHRPASKSTHVRHQVGFNGAAAASSSAAFSSASAVAAPVAAELPPMPIACHVYAEELLWGVHSSLSTLPPSLQQPFDVIIMADVVYDAYSTTGVGSEKVDNFRRLFHTLCLLAPPTTTVLMTYTPRRAPEKMFFEMLATEFVWEAYPAARLLPRHDNIDDRIWIYHLHRTKLAGKMNAVRQKVYIHEDHYGSEVAITRARQQEEKERRQAAAVQPPADGQPVFRSASAMPASPPAAASSPTAAATDEASPMRVPQPVNLTPTFTRYLEAEEERQQRVLQEKIRQRESQRKAREEQVGR